VKRKKIILLVSSATLLVAAGLSWLNYLGQGIAYGDLVGVKGREQDLATIGNGAIRSLWIAASCEGLAVGLITWIATDPDGSVGRRLVASFGLALLIDVCTYAVIRGI